MNNLWTAWTPPNLPPVVHNETSKLEALFAPIYHFARACKMIDIGKGGIREVILKHELRDIPNIRDRWSQLYILPTAH
jgi:hypothetical protein